MRVAVGLALLGALWGCQPAGVGPVAIAPPGVSRVPAVASPSMAGAAATEPRVMDAPVRLAADFPVLVQPSPDGEVSLLGYEVGVQVMQDGRLGAPQLVAYGPLVKETLPDGSVAAVFPIPTAEMPRNLPFQLAVRYVGLFQGGLQGAQTTARYLSTDTASGGSWVGRLGLDGALLAGGPSTLTSATQVTVAGASSYTWTSTSSEPRALEVPGAGRLAAAWYQSVGFTIDVALLDAKPHRVSVYLMDFEGGRVQSVDVVDAGSGALLDSQFVSGFTGGRYLQWLVSGHVQLRVTNNGGQNAVVNALFIDPPGGLIPSAPSPVHVQSPWGVAPETAFFTPDPGGDPTKGVYTLSGGGGGGGPVFMFGPPPMAILGRILRH